MKSVSEFAEQLLSNDEYSFSWDELAAQVSKTEAGLKSEINRLIVKKELINLRKGFYLIPGQRYKKTGYLPVELFSEKLFKWLKRPYYLGLFSAAHLHGAAHQQIQQTYIITALPTLHDIKNDRFNIRFFSKKTWSDNGIVNMKSDAGTFRVSSPALTCVDLLRFQTNIGGTARILSILEELVPEIDQNGIKNLLSCNCIKSSLQRLGYLLDYWQNDEPAQILYDHLKNQHLNPVLIDPDKNKNPGRTDNRWKVVINLNIDEKL